VIVEPDPKPASPRPLRINDVVEVPGGSIMLLEIASDGREKFAVFDYAGRRHALVFDRDKAEAFAARLVALVP
jgi:hypothetical protein